MSRKAAASSALIVVAVLVGEVCVLGTSVAAQTTVTQKVSQYQSDLKQARERHDRLAEAMTLVSLGLLSKQIGQTQKALEYDQGALLIYRELSDRRGEANTLSVIGEAYGAIGQPAKALEFLCQALPISREVHDHSVEARTLSMMGQVYSDTGQPQKALEVLNQALQVSRDAHDAPEEANALYVMGEVYTAADPAKALDFLKQALSARQKLGDRGGEGTTLNAIGEAYWASGQPEAALEFYNKALPIEREVGSRSDEAVTLNDIGAYYQASGQPEKGLDFYNQALPIEREVGKRSDEAVTLNQIGTVYTDIGKPEKALDFYNLALPIEREVNSLSNESLTLHGIGEVYQDLGQPQKALEYYNQALPIERKVGDRRAEATTLNNVAIVYRDIGERTKALEVLTQVLPIHREVGDRRAEATTLHNIGAVYAELGQIDKAREYYNQALPIELAVNDPVGEAYTRWRLASAYNSLGGYLAALRLAQKAQNPSLQASIYASLMGYYRTNSQPEVAIFFGKEAVNRIQSIRSDIRNLSSDLQKGFLKANESPYHMLVDLLIEKGRLAEAEQVLHLLKEDEYFDFVRGEGGESPAAQTVALKPAEEIWGRRFHEIASRLVSSGAERGELVSKKELTAEETRRLIELDRDVAAGNAAFEKFMSDLAEHVGAQAQDSAKVEQLREAQGIMEHLRELPQGTVAIYTLVGEDKYRAILVTPDVEKAYEYPIKSADLNRMILEFRQVAENPRLDPRPMGGELYKVLVGGLSKDLELARAKTVMWSLDGALRYLPIAALHDGKQYLVEQYALSVFTPASNARLKDRPDQGWTAAGFGVTKSHEGAAALPEVRSELLGIIADTPGHGILPGEIKLDDYFTEDTMRETLLKRYPVVHVASHFLFQPGNERNSYLLLGDGSHLSLAELKNMPNLFGGVQLLTLSACNTGVGDTDGDGKEVEGMGVMAQRKGAKAVVASLWSVADASTSLFMQEFYRVRESSRTTKAAALRQAQLALLHGTGQGSASGSHRALVHDELPKPEQSKAPAFQLDTKAPYSHPYYWAPFFLMGNWL